MSSKRILIVEDEALISMNMEDMIMDEGYVVVGPAGSVKDALHLISTDTVIDCALLDVNLRGETVYPVAEELVRRRVPFAFTSGYGHAGIDPRFTDRVVLPKPIDRDRLVSFIRAALAMSQDEMRDS